MDLLIVMLSPLSHEEQFKLEVMERVGVLDGPDSFLKSMVLICKCELCIVARQVLEHIRVVGPGTRTSPECHCHKCVSAMSDNPCHCELCVEWPGLAKAPVVIDMKPFVESLGIQDVRGAADNLPG